MTRRPSDRFNLIIIAVLIIITVLLAPLGLFYRIKTATAACCGYLLARAGFADSFTTADGRLRDDNRRLALLVVERENRISALERELGHFGRAADLGRSGWLLVPAQVVFYDPSLAVSRMLINVGTAAGITAGMLVLDGECLVGLVANAAEYSAEVLLVDDAQSIFPVFIGRDRLAAHLKGVGRGRPLDVRFVDNQPEYAVITGDSVVTSGYVRQDGVVITESIPIGAVVNDPARDTEPHDDYKRIRVRPFAVIPALRTVFVLAGLGTAAPAPPGAP
ncbi:MAG: rod shape-determining protein MreC [Planctomycetota bacterium]